MSAEIYAKAAALAADRSPFAMATVVRVEGSSSARRGAKAIIDAQGKLLLGWVGGGCAESTVRNEARRCIRDEAPLLITLDMTEEVLGVGMPCGGKMDVYIEPVLPKPELLIAGHGRITETLCALGSLLGFRVTVDDPGADPAAFPQAARVLSQDFDLKHVPVDAQTYIVIATQHKNDHLWLRKALEGNAAYVALVASHHRARLVLDYLAAEGIAAEKLDQVRAPAGFDLGAVTPEEIALSIMSQIVAVRRGSDSKGVKQIGLMDKADAADRLITQCEPGDSQ